ncbi:glycosyltransferase [Mesobacillus maritimus]|uniref:glycosyltransferase n=1 Tax=Mesobacillus maritimus TaxID=1643336 RepID=UPI00384B86B5
MEPKVTIIIPFYNCPYVDQAIQSALNQTYQNVEIIVVDDGSTINTDRIIPFQEKIIYLRKENGGTATALNHGIGSASGEYIAWLSSDDYFVPEKIAKQMTFMLNNNAEVSFTNFDIIDQNNQVITPFCGLRFSDIKEVYKQFFILNPVNGCTVIMKKSLFEQIGYFNPVHRYTHDYEMWFRVLISGHKMDYLDEALTKFRWHEGSGTSQFQPEIKKEMELIESCFRPMLAEFLKQQ